MRRTGQVELAPFVCCGTEPQRVNHLNHRNSTAIWLLDCCHSSDIYDVKTFKSSTAFSLYEAPLFLKKKKKALYVGHFFFWSFPTLFSYFCVWCLFFPPSFHIASFSIWQFCSWGTNASLLQKSNIVKSCLKWELKNPYTTEENTREFQWLAQVHTALQWPRQDLNPPLWIHIPS